METQKEFRNKLLGLQIKGYTDDKNLTYQICNIERFIRWRFITEEYNPELIYIQGPKNIAAVVLGRLDIVGTNDSIKPNMSSLAEHFF